MTQTSEIQSGITRDIYGMPAFITLEVSDVRAAVRWFTEALDFIELFAMPPGDDPVLVHVRRWRYQDILLRRSDETVEVGGGVQLSIAAQYDELDGLAARAQEFPGTTVVGPADTPWNSRDFSVTSPQGLRIVYTARRPEPLQDAAFTADMRQWSKAQSLPAS